MLSLSCINLAISPLKQLAQTFNNDVKKVFIKIDGKGAKKLYIYIEHKVDEEIIKEVDVLKVLLDQFTKAKLEAR